jgi:hypothetical protein
MCSLFQLFLYYISHEKLVCVKHVKRFDEHSNKSAISLAGNCHKGAGSTSVLCSRVSISLWPQPIPNVKVQSGGKFGAPVEDCAVGHAHSSVCIHDWIGRPQKQRERSGQQFEMFSFAQPTNKHNARVNLAHVATPSSIIHGPRLWARLEAVAPTLGCCKLHNTLFHTHTQHWGNA